MYRCWKSQQRLHPPALRRVFRERRLLRAWNSRNLGLQIAVWLAGMAQIDVIRPHTLNPRPAAMDQLPQTASPAVAELQKRSLRSLLPISVRRAPGLARSLAATGTAIPIVCAAERMVISTSGSLKIVKKRVHEKGAALAARQVYGHDRPLGS